MDLPFSRLNITVSGDFGEARSLQQISHWIVVNGGVFSHEVNPRVTHLVCSRKHYEENVVAGMLCYGEGFFMLIAFKSD